MSDTQRWALVALALVAALLAGFLLGVLRKQFTAAGEHIYLSTACLHGRHEHCRSAVAADGGRKKPGTCKFCGAVCVCPVCDHANMNTQEIDR